MMRILKALIYFTVFIATLVVSSIQSFAMFTPITTVLTTTTPSTITTTTTLTTTSTNIAITTTTPIVTAAIIPPTTTAKIHNLSSAAVYQAVGQKASTIRSEDLRQDFWAEVIRDKVLNSATTQGKLNQTLQRIWWRVRKRRQREKKKQALIVHSLTQSHQANQDLLNYNESLLTGSTHSGMDLDRSTSYGVSRLTANQNKPRSHNTMSKELIRQCDGKTRYAFSKALKLIKKTKKSEKERSRLYRLRKKIKAICSACWNAIKAR